MCAVFQDKGHLSYYYEPTRCGGKKEKEIKERAKLVKSLSKKLSTFSSVGFGVDPQDGLVGEVQSKTISVRIWFPVTKIKLDTEMNLHSMESRNLVFGVDARVVFTFWCCRRRQTYCRSSWNN